jgi:hypothetical protein
MYKAQIVEDSDLFDLAKIRKSTTYNLDSNLTDGFDSKP